MKNLVVTVKRVVKLNQLKQLISDQNMTKVLLKMPGKEKQLRLEMPMPGPNHLSHQAVTQAARLVNPD